MANSSFKPFNPLGAQSDEEIGTNIVEEALKQTPRRLSEIEQDQFEGAGVYILYTVSKTGLYAPWGIGNVPAEAKLDNPIYIGKATPKGGRRGGSSIGEGAGTALRKRLREHAESIKNAAGTDLDIKDFWYRRLVLNAWWIPLGEEMLIRQFTPVWNNVLCGFGNHAVGSTRSTQEKSAWDIVHAGRKSSAAGTKEEEKARALWRDQVKSVAPGPYTPEMKVEEPEVKQTPEQLGFEVLLGPAEGKKVSR